MRGKRGPYNMKVSMEQRFWNYVNKTKNCWLWTGAKNKPNGYGLIGIVHERKNIYVHRYSWQLNNGDIPNNLMVLHKCDTPSCVNPKHLFLGDQKTNMTDAAKKGRTTKGEKSGLSKLTNKKVLKIRSLINKGNFTLEEIGNMFGVTHSNISHINTRKTWAHI